MICCAFKSTHSFWSPHTNKLQIKILLNFYVFWQRFIIVNGSMCLSMLFFLCSSLFALPRQTIKVSLVERHLKKITEFWWLDHKFWNTKFLLVFVIYASEDLRKQKKMKYFKMVALDSTFRSQTYSLVHRVICIVFHTIYNNFDCLIFFTILLIK